MLFFFSCYCCLISYVIVHWVFEYMWNTICSTKK